METIEETATAATEATETRRFRVFRFKRGDRGPHLDEFDVPVTARTTLLRRHAMDPVQPGPLARAAPLVPTRLVRDLRRPRERT